MLGGGPFFLVNSDTIWIDGVRPNLERLAASFDAARMDALLLMAPTATAPAIPAAAISRWRPTGGSSAAPSATWCRSSMPAPRSSRPRSSPASPPGASSMSPLFDRAAEAGRLHGLRLDGIWMHVGTPDAVAAAEAALIASAA